MSHHDQCPGEGCPVCERRIALAEEPPEPGGLAADYEAADDWHDRERWH